MSKFLGKFHKDQEYSDDQFGEARKGRRSGRKNEHGEIKKLIVREELDDLEDTDYTKYYQYYKR